MKRNRLTIAALVGVLTLSLAGTGCQKLEARDQLKKGVQAFKSNKYGDAIEHFQKSIELDPSSPMARLYLATAYRSQWVPGADSNENKMLAQRAKEEFSKVLAEDPKSELALAQLASINYEEAGGIQDPAAKSAKFDEAARWYKKLLEVKPTDKTAHYSLGVLTWAKWYPVLGKARAEMGMKPEDPGPLKDAKVRASLRETWSTQIDEGIGHLREALKIDPEYDDAMAYLNLLIREKADLADNPDDYKKQVAEADSWVQKALETKKVKAQRALDNPGGVKTE